MTGPATVRADRIRALLQELDSRPVWYARERAALLPPGSVVLLPGEIKQVRQALAMFVGYQLHPDKTYHDGEAALALLGRTDKDNG